MIATPPACESECDRYDFYYKVESTDCISQYRFDLISYYNWFTSSYFTTEPPYEIISPCQDFVFEFEFKTLDLQMQYFNGSLGGPDFNAYSNTGVTEIYRCSPNNTTSIFGTPPQFFNSTLLNPNATFTIRMVDVNNPECVFHEQEISFASNEIGSLGAVTSLQSLIDNGDILDQNDALIHGQNIKLNGTLIVDTDYEFNADFGSKYNVIKMGTDAKIIVQSGNELIFNKTLVSACSTNWDRILIEPQGIVRGNLCIFKDATDAFELQDNANLSIGNTQISNCDNGISSYGDNMKNIEISLTGDYISDNTNDIFLENVEDLNLDYTYSYLINNTENGIYLDNTNLTASQLVCQDNKVGINAVTPNEYMRINECRFNTALTDPNLSVGVASLGTEYFRVKDSRFYLLNVGIFHNSIPFSKNFILKNTMFDMNANIVTLSNEHVTGRVYYNELSASRANMFLLGLNANSFWLAGYNPLLFASDDSGSFPSKNFIVYQNKRFNIHNNPYMMATHTNIYAKGGLGLYVADNASMASENDGIYLMDVQCSNVICNNLTSSNHGLRLFNDCSESNIQGNGFSAAQKLNYGSLANPMSNTGGQSLNGNQFGTTTASSPGAFNYTPSFVAQQNQYIVEYGSVQGESNYPFFESAYEFWFSKSNNPNALEYTCNENISVDNVCTTDNFVGDIDLFENGYYDQYTGEAEYKAQYKLLEGLIALENTGEELSNVQASWKSYLEDQSWSKFILIEEIIQDVLEPTDIEAAQLEEANEAIDQFVDTVEQIEWMTLDTINDSIIIDSILQETAELLNKKIVERLEEIHNITEPKRMALLDLIPELEVINEEISSNEWVSVNNQKQINTLLFKKMSNQSYDSLDIKQLESIAQQCLGNGGDAVLTARSLLVVNENMLIDDFIPLTYNDECIQLKKKGSGKQDYLLNQPNTTMSVYPNPARDILYINIDQKNIGQQIQIFNIYGNEMYNTNLQYITTDINISQWPIGIYYIKYANLSQGTKMIEVLR